MRAKIVIPVDLFSFLLGTVVASYSPSVASLFSHVVFAILDTLYLPLFLYLDADALGLFCRDDNRVFFLCLLGYK